MSPGPTFGPGDVAEFWTVRGAETLSFWGFTGVGDGITVPPGYPIAYLGISIETGCYAEPGGYPVSAGYPGQSGISVPAG